MGAKMIKSVYYDEHLERVLREHNRFKKRTLIPAWIALGILGIIIVLMKKIYEAV